jgi:hypothetical protein
MVNQKAIKKKDNEISKTGNEIHGILLKEVGIDVTWLKFCLDCQAKKNAKQEWKIGKINLPSRKSKKRRKGTD